ncbi:hypothetical protein [Bacillus suaedaesalsae]|uniref:DUF4878 domain-containing protein n=1 Tax=Bacillus suaedaesalsae TaxID=2810349 RepID=A0ABS2DHP3_9BACI|nr:hypothetical protein [Bacillus suaedaesalsae]MBM6618002.1 hypothetical protein [Bacillus suaedaesalsae]
MKLRILFIFLMLSVILGCTQKVQPNSPENTALLLKQAIAHQDYESFTSLFSEGRKGSFSKDEFAKLQALTTAGIDFKTYELITFENGEMLLIKITPQNEEKEVLIEDIQVIQQEMKELFTD